MPNLYLPEFVCIAYNQAESEAVREHWRIPPERWQFAAASFFNPLPLVQPINLVWCGRWRGRIDLPELQRRVILLQREGFILTEAFVE